MWYATLYYTNEVVHCFLGDSEWSRCVGGGVVVNELEPARLLGCDRIVYLVIGGMQEEQVGP